MRHGNPLFAEAVHMQSLSVLYFLKRGVSPLMEVDRVFYLLFEGGCRGLETCLAQCFIHSKKKRKRKRKPLFTLPINLYCVHKHLTDVKPQKMEELREKAEMEKMLFSICACSLSTAQRDSFYWI